MNVLIKIYQRGQIKSGEKKIKIEIKEYFKKRYEENKRKYYKNERMI
jgi:hypothetical protein